MPGQKSENKLLKFFRLSAADKWLLGRAVGWLAYARTMLAFNTFEDLCEKLQRPANGESGKPDRRYLERVQYAIAAAAGGVPWRSDCFPQSIAGCLLLRRDGLDPTIHLGVTHVGDDILNGHAWLTCGDVVVTGGAEAHRYSEMHRF